MPLQNRVTPFGDIVATPERGGLMGNRGGRIHDPRTRTLLSRRWASKRWIACVLSFKGRRRSVMETGYTELFFLDESTALASGHRPCFECRRADATAFAAAWMRAFGLGKPPGANAIDDALHQERLRVFGGEREVADATALPDGAIVARNDAAFLVANGRLRRWTPGGYGEAEPPSGALHLLTPPSIVAVLAAGYRLRV